MKTPWKHEQDRSLGYPLTRQMKQLLNGQFEQLFNEVKTLQQPRKTTIKYKLNAFKELDQHMIARKVSTALWGNGRLSPKCKKRQLSPKTN